MCAILESLSRACLVCFMAVIWVHGVWGFQSLAKMSPDKIIRGKIVPGRNPPPPVAFHGHFVASCGRYVAFHGRPVAFMGVSKRFMGAM